ATCARATDSALGQRGLLRVAFQRQCFRFYQAEDGIRDKLVTGVQPCALPISRDVRWSQSHRQDSRWPHSAEELTAPARSEERRVGKEWRSRWSTSHSKHT